jgi:hypothetical protein
MNAEKISKFIDVDSEKGYTLEDLALQLQKNISDRILCVIDGKFLKSFLPNDFPNNLQFVSKRLKNDKDTEYLYKDIQKSTNYCTFVSLSLSNGQNVSSLSNSPSTLKIFPKLIDTKYKDITITIVHEGDKIEFYNWNLPVEISYFLNK